nr:uncharacterized protein LOC100176598 [Ciona intestinalis]|eukprot:XP_002124754.3 uncharacterized protein LOC100176598 [Ciona intestinalis]
MSKLKREAMGQYNYVAPTPMPDKNKRSKPKHSYPDFYPHSDVTVQLVDENNKDLKLFNIKPPKMFETSYHQDYRHPPEENLRGRKNQDESLDTKENYTAYVQKAAKNKSPEEKHTKPKVSTEELTKPERSFIKSAGDLKISTAAENVRQKPLAVARAQTAEAKRRPVKEDRVNEEFYRSVLNARSGPEWKRPPDISYDILNPEKPPQERATKPYGAKMENSQEKISNIVGEKRRVRPASVNTLASGRQSKAGSVKSSSSATENIPQPSVTRIGLEYQNGSKAGSRASTASGRSSNNSRYIVTRVDAKRPMTSGSSISSVNGDYLLETGRHLNEILETIQEDEIQEQLQDIPIPNSPKQVMQPISDRKRTRKRLKKPVPPTDLFEKRGPDPRFYPSKKKLRTPNEMERFKKARGRAFMRNVEQAIPELDLRDHEMKYQPERQLLQDARWKIRQDVKDVKNKNLHSLVDRFEKRHQIIKEETRTRLGDTTYIERDPVSIYKLHNKGPNSRSGRPGDVGFKVSYPLHNRRRITPSMGSVQRARNFGSYAQIFNQPCAPPHWGPQKVDSGLFLPPMAQGI